MKIVIWTGAAWETWGPNSMLDGGIGGSETAAINMAAELARGGHEVSVIGRVTPCQQGKVSYIDYLSYLEWSSRGSIECDVFISSRQLSALRLLAPKARLSILWMHDIHVGEDYQGMMREYDIIFCLSQWARQVLIANYGDVPKEKFVLTRNGLNPTFFLRECKKEGCKVIYSSSPDRGLDRLLDYWPKIRELQPDAELHVYYGFDNWEKMATVQMCGPCANPAMARASLAAIAAFKERLARMAELGVTLHGRVGQGKLAAAFLASSMWLYPTNFPETSCITAMEAQAAGLHIVTSRLAALSETVKHGCLVTPPNTRDGYESEFLGHVKELLAQDSEPPARECDLDRDWALRHLSWSEVAGQWEELFMRQIEKKAV